MKAILRILLAFPALVVASALANAQAPNPLVGTWRLVSFASEILETKVVRYPFGAHPGGFITYTPDGRMMTVLVNPSRKPPAAPAATDAEALGLYRTLIAYGGTYRIDGNKVVHHLEVSWNQAWTGTDQKRFFKVEANQLTLTTAPLVSTVLSNAHVVSTLIFERVQ